MAKKVILTVIDGLGPELLDRAIAAGRAPAIERLQSLGSRTDACVSTFPSLTPVCLAALVTGRHPAGSGIPNMTWYNRDERRIVEYGSSFAATLAEGTRQMLEDVLVNFNLVHMSHSADTVFETLEDAGLVTAAVNCYVCRGRVRHPITRPSARKLARRLGIVDAVYGPRRYFFGELFASDHTGAPRNFGGSVDRHSGHVGRWLVTRDGFDFLFLYFYETDAAQHRAGDVLGAVERVDAGIALMVEAAGGWTAFLDRYAVAIVADHSQSAVHEVADLSADTDLRLFRSSRRDDPDDCDLALTASNRVAMAYLMPGARADRLRGGAPAGPPPGRRRDDVARGRLARGPPRGRRAAVPARRRPPGRAGRPVVGGRRPRPARSGRVPERPGADRRLAGLQAHRRRRRVGASGVGVRRRRRPPPRRRRQPRLAAGRGLARPADHRGLRRGSGDPGRWRRSPT